MTTDATPAVAAASSIDPATSLGAVSLTVSDLERTRAFYEDVLGLAGTPDGSSLRLAASGGGSELMVLHADRDARPFDSGANGLFHLALLVPSRIELARSLRRIADERWPLTGASDHLVSEALYLRDPDGNGIEIYRDRPRTEWQLDEHGAPRMATLRLDLSDLAREPDHERDSGSGADAVGVAAGARIGHVHLQVSDLDAAERFYGDVLGFDVTARSYPGALFMSAGGYHHHIGLNTWQTLGAAPLAPGGVGLRSFEVLLPGHAALKRALDRVGGAGIGVARLNGGLGSPGAPAPALVHDPFGIAVVLRCV